MPSQHILLIDDEEIFCEVLARSLAREGYQVDTAFNLETAVAKINQQDYRYAVVDLRIGDESGLTLVKQMQEVSPDTRIVMLTGYASIATAVEAIKLGATHYLTKPAEVEDIVAAFGKEIGDESVKPADAPLSVQRMEWEHIQKVLHEHNGNISAAARAMGMHRRTLQRKLQKRPVKQ
ncbi:MAG: response regulator transcription factor [Gammaproteobacteria bacterium]|nr:response regulator transcription factor [Gammaproteobacteria bacterium]